MRAWLISALLAAAVLIALACSSSEPQNAAAPDAGDAGDESVLPPMDASGCMLADPADAGGFSRGYAMLSSGSVQRDKAFYLTTLLEKDAPTAAAIAASAPLTMLGAAADARLRGAPAKCGDVAACYAAELKWADADVTTSGAALAAAATSLASAHLRPSGEFILHASASDADLVAAAWKDTTLALGNSYDVYAASLDGPTLHAVVSAVIAAHPEPLAFYRPLLEVVLGALVAQNRLEDTLYEPLDQGENKAALAALPSVAWSAYPYSAIMVPGEGPTSPDVALNPVGAQRCDLAAARYAAKYAPVFILSGGHVHPDRTPYCEALEMKKYLMTTYAIPESAILVDPFARHTTTNLRNVSREVFRYGIPTDRPVLLVSDFYQSLYIAYHDGAFDTRCNAELFYLPYRVLTPLTPYDTCMLPSPLTLQLAGTDPLDP